MRMIPKPMVSDEAGEYTYLNRQPINQFFQVMIGTIRHKHRVTIHANDCEMEDICHLTIRCIVFIM